MSQCPFGGDGEFSFERFAGVYDSGLANNLGNLYSRILTMCAKYFEGNLGSTEGIDLTAWRRGLDLAWLVGDLRELMIGFDYSTVLQRI
jgi:methionyl-tRNA synthetase